MQAKRSKLRWATALPFLLGCLGESAAARAVDRFVSKNKKCSDSGPGSAVHPWCRLAVAGRRARPGDRVLIGEGIYREPLKVEVSGKPGQPIIFQPAPGAAPVIDGRGLHLDEEGLVGAERQAHLVFRGLTLKNAPFYGVKISGCRQVRVERLLLRRSQHGGIVIDEGSNQIEVLDNEVTGTDSRGREHGIHEAITISNVRGFLVARNRVHHGVKEGIDAKDGSQDGEIRDNQVHHMGQVGIYLNHAARVKVYRNNVHHCGTTGIQLAVGDYATGPKVTSGNELSRNLVWANRENGIEFWRTSKGEMKSNRIVHNVVHANGGAGLVLENAYQNQIHNNVFSGNRRAVEGNAIPQNTLSHNLFYQNGASDGALGDDTVRGAPGFVDAARGDFRLRPGSPAVDAGLKLGRAFVGAAPDLGAFESPLIGAAPARARTP